jgi:sugar/nucleoside kinase (ribokinase family)
LADKLPADQGAAILCAGIAVQDIVMRVESFPMPGGKVPASDFITVGGGCAANAALAIARLGGTVRFSGPLGDTADPVSNEILSGLTKEGVGDGGVVRVSGATASVSLILLDAAGEKMIATLRGNGLNIARPADAAAAVSFVAALMVDNRFPEFVTPLCRAANRRNIPVVIDLDQQTAPDDPLLSLGTHVIASSEGLRGTTGIDDLRGALVWLGSKLDCFLMLTDGPNGVYWLDREKVRQFPAFRVDAIDTLGAGDTFHGAFTLALVEGHHEADAMRFAAAAAAIKCTRFGGQAGAPTRTELDDFLKRAG